MQLREHFTYAILMPTSMGVRITPPDRQPVHTSSLFRMQSTSAESNVGQIAASLGMRVKLLTAFVKDSPIARFIKDDLRKRNLEYEGPELPQGGPWGMRHQFNIADSGYGLRGPLVWNDRAGEVGRTLSSDYYDLEQIFAVEGVGIVHISGLIAALSDSSAALCLAIAQIARKNGTLISFDLNYRASFWVGREKALREVFEQIASLADILIGNEEDFQLALGFDGPATGGSELPGKVAAYKKWLSKCVHAIQIARFLPIRCGRCIQPTSMTGAPYFGRTAIGTLKNHAASRSWIVSGVGMGLSAVCSIAS